MKLTIAALFLLVSASAFAGSAEGPGHGSGPAHPAAFLCKKLNGQQVSGSGPAGSIEYCELDEARISSMSLWYSLNGKMELAAKVYLAQPLPRREFRDAADYCEVMGGKPRTLISYDRHVQSDECVFEENGHLSMIDQLTLLRGPQYPTNRRLTQILLGM